VNEETQNSIFAVCAAVALMVAITLISSCAGKLSSNSAKIAKDCIAAGGTWTNDWECYQ
jgi:hypothetical protein